MLIKKINSINFNFNIILIIYFNLSAYYLLYATRNEYTLSTILWGIKTIRNWQIDK